MRRFGIALGIVIAVGLGSAAEAGADTYCKRYDNGKVYCQQSQHKDNNYSKDRWRANKGYNN